MSGRTSYRLGYAVAATTSFLIVWTTIVRDDGDAAGYFMVILAAGAGAFAALFRAAGMARAMLGVAVMQAALAGLIATAPITAQAPGGPMQVVLFNGVFTALWLLAGALFRTAAKADG